MTGQVFRFSDVTVDSVARRVTVAGREVSLPPRVFGTLVTLLERANAPVPRDAILASVWPDSHVVPNSVAQAVGSVRRALAGSAGGWRIEPVPGVGYRFVGDVRTGDERLRPHRRWPAWLVACAPAIAASLLVATAGGWRTADDGERGTGNAALAAIAERLASRRAEDLLAGRRLYERAAAGGRSAAALAGLAEAHYLTGFYGLADAASSADAAERAASRAIAIDGSMARAWAVRASVALDRDWDLAASGRDFRRALALDAGDAQTHLWAAWWCLAAGLVPEARAAVDRAVSLDPFSPSILTARATFAYLAGDVEAAIADSRRALRIAPAYFRARLRLGLALLSAGRTGEAVAHLEVAHRLEPDVPETRSALAHALATTARPAMAVAMVDHDLTLPFYDRAIVLAGLGRRAEAIDMLHAARRRRQLTAGLFEFEPRLASLHGLPGYETLRSATGIGAGLPAPWLLDAPGASRIP